MEGLDWSVVSCSHRGEITRSNMWPPRKVLHTASSLRVLACSVRPLGERLVDTLNFFRKSLRSSLSGVDGTSITLATEEMLEPDRDCRAPSQLNIMRLLLVVLSLR